MSRYISSKHGPIVARAATVAWLHHTSPMQSVERALREARLGIVDYPSLHEEVCNVVASAALGAFL